MISAGNLLHFVSLDKSQAFG
jgi:hypothetical protein